MATAVIMPRQGQSVESCIIGKWHKKVGDAVAIGDILFSYETDKAAFDELASVSGKMLAILFQEGADVPCLETVCVIGDEGEQLTLRQSAPAGPPKDITSNATLSLRPERSNPESSPLALDDAAGVDRPRASGRAKSLAAKHDIDPAALSGTGPNGRVIERDVEKAILAGVAPCAAFVGVKAADSFCAVEEKHSAIRKIIARSMHQSLSTMAQLTLNASFDATAILAFRKRLKAANETKIPTLGDIVLFAVSRTLLAHPAFNAHYDDEKTTYFRTVNLGVAIDTPRGLMVPTIFGAEKLMLAQISGQVKSLADSCRKGSVSPDALKGGTFTVTNLGVFGIESFTPVINPPQTAILGVCGLSTRIREGKNGGVETYSAMGLSLTIDHRAVDGAPAAKFLQTLCETLENFHE